MRQIRAFADAARYVSICALLAAVGLGTFHAWYQDLLLLATDAPTLLIYLSFMEITLTAAACAVFSFYWFLEVDLRTRLRHAVLLVLTACFLLIVFQILLGLLSLSPAVLASYHGLPAGLRLTVRSALPSYIVYIEVAALIAIAVLIRDARDMHRRAGMLGGILLAGAVSGIALGYILLLDRAAPAHSPVPAPKRVVLIVLDGFGADVMKAIRATSDPFTAAPPDLSLTATTAYPYTAGFFGALYTGSLDCAQTKDNLFSRLQSGGVDVRWISFHRNGYPDTSRCHVSGYRGLRSYALVAALAFLPRMLDLDYNVNVTSLEPAAPELADKVLIPELRELARRGSRSFTVIHLRTSPTYIAAYGTGANIPELNELLAVVKARDYTYPPALEPGVRHEKALFVASAANVLRNMARLIAHIRADPALAGTVVMITADHGTVFGGGHIYYGYHVDRAVLQTPLLIWGLSAKEIGNRPELIYTPDLTDTILDIFGLKGLGRDGGSLREPQIQNRTDVATLALPGPVTGHWYLAVTDRKGTNVFDILRRGTGKMTRLDPAKPYVEELNGDPTSPELSDVHRWLDRFGVSPTDVQARYRQPLYSR